MYVFIIGSDVSRSPLAHVSTIASSLGLKPESNRDCFRATERAFSVILCQDAVDRRSRLTGRLGRALRHGALLDSYIVIRCCHAITDTVPARRGSASSRRRALIRAA
jgi:hypothetical protein